MDTNSNLSNNTGILLISHGSTLPYGEEVFSEIKDKFIKKTGLPTEVGYMKVSNPSIAGAIDILKENNLDRIIALPVFLAEGIHTNIDIPIMLGCDALQTDPRCPDGVYPDNHYLNTCDNADFDGDIELLGPIGSNDDLLKIIDERIKEALSKSKLGDVKTGILLVSHGSRLKYNYEFISELYEKFKKTTTLPSSFAFMELTQPSIAESANKLTRENDIERLIVVPVFIATGKHTTHDIPHILGLIEDNHSHSHGHSHDLTPIDFDGEILYPDPFGSDDILVDILVSMINEVL